MKRYLIPLVLLAFTALLIAPLAQTMRTANTTNDLVLLSPYTINTNTYVVTEGTIGDGTATWWTFVAGDVTGPDATHLQPLLYPTAGRWVKNTGGSGGTNVFNTLIVTNLYGTYNYFSNIYVTNLFVTNIYNRGGAKPMIKLGDTNIYITNTYVTINGTNLAVVNPTDGYVPYRNSATNFLDSAWYMVGGTNIGIDSQIILGPGTTNVIYRNGKDLYYTNSNNDVQIGVINGLGNAVTLESQGSAGVVSGDGGMVLRSLTSQAEMYGGSFFPVVDLAEDLGRTGNTWKSTITSNLVLRGFYDIADPAVNYSRLVAYHAGTNDAIHFDSQSGGTAGEARDFIFSTNGVPFAFYDVSVGRYIITNAVSADWGYLMAGSGTFDIYSGGTALNIGNSSKSIVLSGANLMPNTDDMTLGADGVPWYQVWMDDSYHYGFNNGGNYSRMHIYQTSTNDPVVFDQVTVGTAGYSRGFSFRTNCVELFTITGTGGPSSGANWVASGAMDSTLAGKATTHGLDNLQFGSTATWLVFDGDSMTAGYGTLTQTYPYALTNNILTNAWITPQTNVAVAGQTVADMNTRYASYVSPMKPTGAHDSLLFCWGGMNDLTTQTAITTIGRLSNYWAAARADGFKIVAFTVTDSSAFTPAIQSQRMLLNMYIRDYYALYDFLVDTALLFPNYAGCTVDNIHISNAASTYLASCVWDVLSQPRKFARTSLYRNNLGGTALEVNGGSGEGWLQPRTLAVAAHIQGTYPNMMFTDSGNQDSFTISPYNGTTDFYWQHGAGSWDSSANLLGFGAPGVTAYKTIRHSLSVGSTTYLDCRFQEQTNNVSGALTFSYCTNGLHGLGSPVVRWLFNSSGSDQTLTFPIINTGVNGWRTNVYSAVPPAITNNTIMKVILDVGGPTDTLARQTNCYVKFEYYQ